MLALGIAYLRPTDRPAYGDADIDIYGGDHHCPGPAFNAFGRIAAWANLPSGIGGMWFAAHPLKFFNVFC